MTSSQELTDFWEQRYRQNDQMWSGRVNATMAEIVAPLTPGSALDLGCGEGGDVVWLARQGWHATGVDVSPTAVHRGQRYLLEHGLADRAHLAVGDLATWSSDSTFDLVTSCFLHSPVEIPRVAILRRMSSLVAIGGHLLVVSHAAAPPWAPAEHAHSHHFPSPAEDLADLGLDDSWKVLRVQTHERHALGPDGTEGLLLDGVVLAQRLASAR